MKRIRILLIIAAVLGIATYASAAVTFRIGDVYGVPGETVEFDVVMETTEGENVASASLTLNIDGAAGAIPTNPTDGHPFCWVDYRATVTSVRFRDDGVLISVLGPENGLRPPREFARCRFSIEPHSSGEYALVIGFAGWSDPFGFEHDAASVNGNLFVLSEEMPSPTRTPTQTATHTETTAPTNTATSSATPTGTPTPIPVSMPDVIASVFVPLPPLVADVNGDNRVNVADLIEYVRHYGLN